MADMAAPDQLETCWSDLEEMGVTGLVPVTYINSAASIKAFVGERGGVVCTSSNAAATLRWAWSRGERVLFLPDQHLGRNGNTAHKMARAPRSDGVAVWDPNEIWGRPRAGCGEGGADHLVEGTLLGPHAFYRAADR